MGKKFIYWRKWVKEGVHTLHKDELYLSFDEMCAQYNLNCKDIWRCVKIKSCVTKVYDIEMNKGTNAVEELFSRKVLCKANSVICDSVKIVWQKE